MMVPESTRETGVHVIKLGTDASLFFLPGEEKKKTRQHPMQFGLSITFQTVNQNPMYGQRSEDLKSNDFTTACSNPYLPSDHVTTINFGPAARRPPSTKTNLQATRQ
jgi:hypothetical protein